jgi:Xaa-Pro dipeptidase
MTDKTDQVELYGQHLVEKHRRFQDILLATQFDEIVIAAGDSKMQFADDMAYPFVANPYFREWVPLGKRHGSYVQISSSLDRPLLFLIFIEDIWHTAPQSLPAFFEQWLDIVEYASLE